MEIKITSSATIGKENSSLLSGFWKEIQTQGALPRRRSYHSAVVWRSTLFILGGQDLREGALEGLWMLRIDPDSPETERWVRLKLQNGPGSISRHSAVIHCNHLYIYGGTNTLIQYNTLHILNLEKMIWRTLTSEGPTPPRMDSHSCVSYEDQLVLFGGYIEGYRSNLIHIFNIQSETWQVLNIAGPSSRSNHSASVHQNNMFVFGGLDEDHSTLSDFWKLDLSRWEWTSIELKGDWPTARSGHSCQVFGSSLILFGGIKEIGHETNELFLCSLENCQWSLLFHDEQDKTLNPSHLATTITSAVLRKSVDFAKIARNKEESKEKSGPSKDIEKIVPCARDGHSACVIDNKMYVFGGDKHQMSFNDLYVFSFRFI